MTDQKTEQKTLRDEFAMAALSGWIASSPMIKGQPLSGGPEHREMMCALAYDFADAMMAERAARAQGEK